VKIDKLLRIVFIGAIFLLGVPFLAAGLGATDGGQTIFYGLVVTVFAGVVFSLAKA